MKWDEYDWIEWVVQAGRLIGQNPVRTRWRLRAWQDRMKNRSRRIEDKAGAVTRKVKTCPSCRAINSMEETVCSKCGAKLHSRPVEIAERFLRQFGFGLTPESFIAVGCVVVFAVAIYRGGGLAQDRFSFWDLLSVNGPTMIQMGANVIMPGATSPDLGGAATVDGQWWRLLTSVFLHFSIWHLMFNMYALVYLAPQVRDVYGRSKMLFTFVFTGVLASVSSLIWCSFKGHPAVSAGASGAICGLIGLMLVWGHRDGTGAGTMIRNLMARWMMYTLVFGYFIGADNAAHLGGLFAGAVVALLFKEQFHRKSATAWVAAGVASLAIIAAAIVFILYRVFTLAPIVGP